MLQRLTVTFAVLAVAFAIPMVASATWIVVDLGATTVGGANCAAINNLGNVATTVTVSGNTEGIFYNKTTAATTDIGYLDATLPDTYAAGINDSNQVVGYSYLGGSFDKTHAYIWAPGYQITDLTPQETNNTYAPPQAFGINSSGMVTGCEYQTSRSGYQNMVIWNGAAQLTGTYPPTTDAATTFISTGKTTSYGTAINDSGEVIGSGKSGVTFASLFYNGSSVTTPWGDTTKYGWALNDAGIGIVSTTAATDAYNGSTLVAIDSYGGPGDQFAINNAANPMAVGGNGTTAYVYTDSGSMTWSSQTLAAYAAGLGATNAGSWTFQWADGINNNGEIAGFGLIGGQLHAFALLNAPVPEPSTLLLAATGLVGLLAYAWRKRK